MSQGLCKVKATLQGIKDKIEEAEDREHCALDKLRQKKEEVEKNEGEADSFRRRIQLVEADKIKATETLAEKKAKLAEVLSASSEHEVACKELEGIDRESDERLTAMEDDVSVADQSAKESDEQLQEIQQKYKVIVTELEKAKERLEKLESRNIELEEQINHDGLQLREMEAVDEEEAEREQELTEKMEFLGETLKEALARAEEAERRIQPQEYLLESLTEEYDNVKGQVDQIRHDLQEMEDAVEDITGIELAEPKKITERYPVAQEEAREPKPPKELEPEEPGREPEEPVSDEDRSEEGED